MGLVHPGVPKDLCLFARDALGVETFVETGTYLGDTARWAASQFTRVHTVELAVARFERARQTLSDCANVSVYHGHSATALRRFVPSLPGSALFWLDAHWSYEETEGADDPCPLLAELSVASPGPHTILVDDARFFGSPPGPPHPALAWPSLPAIARALSAQRRDEFFLFEDTLIIPRPADARLFRCYLQILQTRSSGSPFGIQRPVPNGAEEFLAAGTTALAEGSVAAALQFAKKALANAPSASEVLSLHGAALTAHGQASEALRDLEMAVQMSPTFYRHRARHCLALASLGQQDALMEALDWAVAADVSAASQDGLTALRRRMQDGRPNPISPLGLGQESPHADH